MMDAINSLFLWKDDKNVDNYNVIFNYRKMNNIICGWLGCKLLLLDVVLPCVEWNYYQMKN
jgi:hypothetical protein